MALAHILAENLSEMTGTHFEVFGRRIQVAGKSNPQMRYSLRATRGEYSHVFQASRPMKLDDLTRWLASISDMVTMGFIVGKALTREDETDGSMP